MQRLKSILGGSIGNILEWYDFGLFAIYAPLFAKLFFPSNNHHLAIMTILSVFAIGFVFRPLGGLIFGYLGDKFGRVKTLRLSILMISIPTFIIGCLPTFATVGIAAPILLILIRIWQGISLGGEYSGSLIYLAESAPKNKSGFITSLGSTGANFGILLAAIFTSLTNYIFANNFEDWAWRLPYLIGGAISLLLYKYRLQLQETQIFTNLKQQKKIPKSPIKLIFKNNIPQMLRTIGLVCMGSTFYYLSFIYMVSFLTHNLHFPFMQISILISICIGIMIFLVPLAGLLSDYIGRKKLLLFNAILIGIIAIPGFYFLINYPNLQIIFLVMILFTIASSLEQGTTCIAVVENYPLPARYTGLSFSYNIGMAIFGGLTPLICEWLITKTQILILPAFFISGCAIITGLVVWFFVKTRSATNIG